MLPDFIIIGTMKGGTSSLYHYLASHRDVVPSSVKETNFFKTDGDFSKGMDWYGGLFTGNGSLAFEASPNYSKRHIFPSVPERMHSVLPDIRLIYVLRDPVDRMVSHYVHNYSHGRESRSFSEAVKKRDRNYIKTSKYFYQLEAFLEYYPAARILLVQSEQMYRNTPEVLGEVAGFLGISNTFDRSSIEKRFHQSRDKKRRSRLETVLCRKTNNPELLSIIRKFTRPFRKSIVRPVVSAGDREVLAEIISPDIEKLRRFTGMNFGGWCL
jgi:hypothetical protein